MKTTTTDVPSTRCTLWNSQCMKYHSCLAKSSSYSGKKEAVFKTFETKYGHYSYKIINVFFGTSQEVLTENTLKGKQREKFFMRD